MCPIDDIIKIHSSWGCRRSRCRCRWFPTRLIPSHGRVCVPHRSAPPRHSTPHFWDPSFVVSITKLNEKLFLYVVSSSEEACVTVCPCVYSIWYILWLLMAAMTGFGLGFALDSFPIRFVVGFVDFWIISWLWYLPRRFERYFFCMKYARYSKSNRTFCNMALTYSKYTY